MIVRVNKTTNYTVMSNTHLRDKELSLKAKGLLSVVLSLPNDWDYSVMGLASISRECETSIKSALNELKLHGYLEVIKRMPNETDSGRIEYEYDFYESPRDLEKQEGKKQGVEILPVEIQGVENQPQLNTNILNKEKENKEERVKRFIPPTVEEVSAYCLERNNGVDAQKFTDYYTANGWYVGKNRMKDWRAAVRTWERNNYQKPKDNGNPFLELAKKEGYL
jgi:hypothetical protein